MCQGPRLADSQFHLTPLSLYHFNSFKFQSNDPIDCSNRNQVSVLPNSTYRHLPGSSSSSILKDHSLASVLHSDYTPSPGLGSSISTIWTEHFKAVNGTSRTLVFEILGPIGPSHWNGSSNSSIWTCLQLPLRKKIPSLVGQQEC